MKTFAFVAKTLTLRGRKKGKTTAAVKPLQRVEDFAPILQQLITFVEVNGSAVEGILRVSGSLPEIKELLRQLTTGQQVDLHKLDIHCVSGTLKALLRLPEDPLLTCALYDALIQSMDLPVDQRTDSIQETLSYLPPANAKILLQLVALAKKIEENKSVTRMTAHNLAVVLGPTIMRPKVEDPVVMLRDASKTVAVVQHIIDHADQVLSGLSDKSETASVESTELDTPEYTDTVSSLMLEAAYQDIASRISELEGFLSELSTENSSSSYETSSETSTETSSEYLASLEWNDDELEIDEPPFVNEPKRHIVAKDKPKRSAARWLGYSLLVVAAGVIAAASYVVANHPQLLENIPELPEFLKIESLSQLLTPASSVAHTQQE